MATEEEQMAGIPTIVDTGEVTHQSDLDPGMVEGMGNLYQHREPAQTAPVESMGNLYQHREPALTTLVGNRGNLYQHKETLTALVENLVSKR